MSESKRPWVYENRNGDHPGNDQNGWGCLGFWSADGKLIMGSGPGWDNNFHEPRPEDVAIILRSVNSHDLAVEAMEEALRHLDVGIPEGRHLHTIAKLRAALAAMKGEGNE